MPKGKTKPTVTKKSSSTSPAKNAKKKVSAKAAPVSSLRRSLHLKQALPVKHKPLPPAYRCLIKSIDILRRHWKVFTWILVIYGLLNILFVHGLSNGVNVNNIKNTLKGSFNGTGGKVLSATTIFVYLIGDTATANGSNTTSPGIYQTILVIVTSLALIWTLRQLYNSAPVRARDAFYKGMYPIIHFFLILLLIAAELLPFLIGAVLFSTVVGSGIAASGLEVFLWGIIFFLLAMVSLYLICSSVIALYIVTLPDMTPMKAIRSARGLVKSRRWLVLRKILFLPLVLFILAGVIMLPFLLAVASIASWVFFVLSICTLAIVNSYMYALYRELIA
jgi:hypothetical protein